MAEIVTGDATVLGSIGSYEVDDHGSDGPWLPFATLPAVGIGSRETPSVQFADGTPIGDVEVVIAPAANTAGDLTQGVPTTLAPDGLGVTIGPLPSGRWVLSARLFRADGRGDGSTYWAITVP